MYTYEKPDNLVEILEQTMANYPDKPLFGTKNSGGFYEWVAYREVGRRVDNVRGGLAELGVGKDDAVGIICNNCVEWAILAFATFGLGARYVPMYESELEYLWEYIVRDSTIKVLFVATSAIYEKVKTFVASIPTLEKIIVVDGKDEYSMKAIELKGERRPIPAIHPGPDDIAVLIYTSGTTGEPKGVLLSHGNLSSNSRAGLRMYPEIIPGGRSFAILPWAHSFGLTAELIAMISIGGAVGLMDSVATITDDLALVRPTWLISVPRVFNKIYEGLWSRMNEQGGLAKKLFVMGVEKAREKRELAEQGRSCLVTNLKVAVADRIVFRKIRDRLGGCLMGSLTGGAAMNVEVARFFFDIGIPLYNCYGLTEMSPAVTMNASFDNRLGSVGKAIENVRIVIDSPVAGENSGDGEIIAYGPNVMKGYHNKPEETKKVMTEDGGFRTGDRGRLDEDGFLYITGRIKEQYKLENGKFVFPVSLEEEIKLVPFVENAMVYGDGKPYNVCLVVPDVQAWEKYAKCNGPIPYSKDLAQRDDVRDRIRSEIRNALNGKYGNYEIPQEFVFISEGFTVENGLLTQTMKLKRHVILERYREQIESAYHTHPA
ncbi:MAG: long-chain fatty acid--CoA ligase [Deltaproteobacteria bacterium]|nr:long-chain fatty acid--CoA ligase [Deltaproteobacteria bacterium]